MEEEENLIYSPEDAAMEYRVMRRGISEWVIISKEGDEVFRGNYIDVEDWLDWNENQKRLNNQQ